jgi:CubicO group peptidase (beta-lactamase class C family)
MSLGLCKTLVTASIALSALSGCWFDGDLKRDNGSKPAELKDGWEIDTPKNTGVSSAVLEAIHDRLLSEDHFRGSLSFLVVKDGKLIFETYLRRNSDRAQYRHIQSATKSITSLLLGIATDQGKVPGVDWSLKDAFPSAVKGLDARVGRITLQELLTMTSGLDFDNEVFSSEMWVDKPDNPLRYMLAKPFYADPGERFYYRDVDPQLVGYMLQDFVGESEREFAAATLFKALKIRDYYWEAGPDGVSMAAHGLHLLPRDLAKLGLLVLNRGLWNGRRVVSGEWISGSTRRWIDSDVEYQGQPLGYGYYWWIVPGVGISMWGHGGQFVLIAPEQNMVLVQTAFPDTDLPESDLPDFVDLIRPLLTQKDNP